MTGFGKGKIQQNGVRICIETKSVNHRFIERRFKMPTIFNSIELNNLLLQSDRIGRNLDFIV